jgi:SAM-dependent methyltransferase
MVTSRAVAEFDELAEVYDATRDPLEPSLVDAMAATFRGWGVRRVLEVGVGTGRVAGPLGARGFEVTGVDASRRMLARAREKGIPRLVRGSAYRLPFAPRAVDLALFVHVLHALDEPAVALAEACRVARRGVAALVRPPGSEPSGAEGRLHPRHLLVDLLRQDGVDLPERARGGPPSAERRLLAEFPPDRLVTVSETDVTEPLAEQLTLFERRASRWTLRVPPDKLARAVAAAREAVGDRTRTYHRVRALALWRRPPRRPRAPAASPPGGAGRAGRPARRT